jgi:hypothetical protein
MSHYRGFAFVEEFVIRPVGVVHGVSIVLDFAQQRKEAVQ